VNILNSTTLWCYYIRPNYDSNTVDQCDISYRFMRRKNKFKKIGRKKGFSLMVGLYLPIAKFKMRHY